MSRSLSALWNHPFFRTGGTHSVDVYLCLFLFCALSLTFSGHGASVDENLVAQTVESMVERGDFTVFEMFQALPGPDGRFYSRYGIGFPILMVPFYLSGYALDFVFPTSDAFFGNPNFFMMLWGGLLLTVATGWIFFRLCRVLGAGDPAAVLLTLSLVFATPFWPYSQSLFRLTTTAFFLLLALYFVLRHRERPDPKWLLGIAVVIALSLNIREDSVIAFALLGLFSLTFGPGRDRLQRALAFGLGGVGGAAIWGGYNFIRFGTFFVENYQDLTFDYPLLISLPQLIWGQRAGLLLYAPLILLLPLSFGKRKNAFETSFWLLCVSILGSYLLLYGRSDMWHGGRCWGPRHMYFLIPFAMLPGVWLFRNGFPVWLRTFLAVGFLGGGYVNGSGVYVHKGQYMTFADCPSFWQMLRRPIAHPLYNTMDDIDLWWIRMIKLHPFSYWPAAFAVLVLCTVFLGFLLWKRLSFSGTIPGRETPTTSIETDQKEL